MIVNKLYHLTVTNSSTHYVRSCESSNKVVTHNMYCITLTREMSVITFVCRRMCKFWKKRVKTQLLNHCNALQCNRQERSRNNQARLLLLTDCLPSLPTAAALLCKTQNSEDARKTSRESKLSASWFSALRITKLYYVALNRLSSNKKCYVGVIPVVLHAIDLTSHKFAPQP